MILTIDPLKPIIINEIVSDVTVVEFAPAIDPDVTYTIEYEQELMEVTGFNHKKMLRLLQLLTGLTFENEGNNVTDNNRYGLIFKKNYYSILSQLDAFSKIIDLNIKVNANYRNLILKAKRTKKLNYKIAVVLLIDRGIIVRNGNVLEYNGRQYKNIILHTIITEMYQSEDKLIISGRQLSLRKRFVNIIDNLEPQKNKIKSVKIANKPLLYETYFTYMIDIEMVNDLQFRAKQSMVLGRVNKDLVHYQNLVYLDDYSFDLELSTFNAHEFSVEDIKIMMESIDDDTQNKIINELIDVYNNEEKNVVLISDRLIAADDNGEHLMRYLSKQNDENEYYFVISKNCSDYQRLAKEFKVVDPNGIFYLKLLVRTKIIMSSHITNWIQESQKLPIPRNIFYSLVNYKYCFLQHGILIEDFSDTLQKVKTHIDVFNATVDFEVSKLSEFDYLYNKNQIKQLGLPRHDNLLNCEKENIILFTPRWRNKICNQVDPQTGEYRYNPRFKQSELCQGINNLLTDAKLNKYLLKKKYKLIFVPHQNMTGQLADFEYGPAVELISAAEASYSELIKKSKLLITDFSSLALDAVYAGVPVITFFPDREHIEKYSTTIPNAFFEQGATKLVNRADDIETVVKLVKKFGIKSKKQDKEILNNIEQFYTYRDTNNCKRVHEEILKGN